MRKIIVVCFISMDGVIQAPGGPEEDTRGGFKYGGWIVPYAGEFMGAVLKEQMSRPFDLLLGRKTFDIWAGHWPESEGPIAEAINKATKYVASNTLTEHPWQKSVFLGGDVAAKVKQLKEEEGPDFQVYGSAVFLQTLMAHDLVDEYWLKIFPVVLGQGQRLFEGGGAPGAFELVDSKTSPNGVIVASYKRAGDVQTGSFG